MEAPGDGLLARLFFGQGSVENVNKVFNKLKLKLITSFDSKIDATNPKTFL